jgi:hypothetical protein
MKICQLINKLVKFKNQNEEVKIQVNQTDLAHKRFRIVSAYHSGSYSGGRGDPNNVVLVVEEEKTIIAESTISSSEVFVDSRRSI